jgi:hypothetical protein
MAIIKVKSRQAIMKELIEMTIEAIIYVEIEVENGKRTCEELKTKHDVLIKMGEDVKGPEKFKFKKNILTPHREELNRNLFAMLKKEQVLESSRISLKAMQDMLKEEQANPIESQMIKIAKESK